MFHSNLNDLKNRGYKHTIGLSVVVLEVNEKEAHLVLKEALRDKDDN